MFQFGRVHVTRRKTKMNANNGGFQVWNFLFQGSIFRCHVSFQGCTYQTLDLLVWTYLNIHMTIPTYPAPKYTLLKNSLVTGNRETSIYTGGAFTFFTKHFRYLKWRYILNTYISCMNGYGLWIREVSPPQKFHRKVQVIWKFPPF